jgi:hypothetical protein
MMRVVQCKVHKGSSRKYKHCFTGRDIVTWLLANSVVRNEESAFLLGNMLLECNVFSRLDGLWQQAFQLSINFILYTDPTLLFSEHSVKDKPALLLTWNPTNMWHAPGQVPTVAAGSALLWISLR